MTLIKLLFAKASRFTYDCRHTPSFGVLSYFGFKHPKKYYTSKVTAISLRTGDLIKSSRNDAIMNQTLTLDFQLTGKSAHEASPYSLCTENCERVDPLQPDDEVVTNFAMTLAQDFPPWAYISWLSKDNKGYVLYKYKLYEFDVSELYNKPH